MKLLLLIPDGVGARNFLLGSFFKQASASCELSVLSVIAEDKLDVYRNGNKVNWLPLTTERDRLLALALRQSLYYAQMHWADTQAMRYLRQTPVRGSWRAQAFTRATRWLGWCAASARGIQLLDQWHCLALGRLPLVEHYRRLLLELQPAIVFCSHQRPSVVAPPVLAAKSLGIPTATFIFSWDNLTSKGRIAAPFDHYLVWSELMRRELLRYYPETAPERVHIVGTPQFDPYADERLLWPRAEFFRRSGADPARPLLCYSGGDAGTCPEDPQHLAILLDLIRSGRIAGHPQVLLRPMPVDDGRRYEQVRAQYPELLFHQPAWLHVVPGDWTRVLPLAEDMEFLANLTYHADLNVNLASTMTLDFALRDKPVVNVAFDVADPPLFGKPLWDYYYQFEHYRPVVELGAARFARSAAELATHVNAYLAHPALDREGRRKLVELEVSLPLGAAGRRVLAALAAIAQ
jgi:hypothetical protein